jgi:flavorubredoxin
MVGRNPLWVAKQHGHSITTMLRAYAAWAEGAIEADIEVIQHAMDFNPRATRKAIIGEQPRSGCPVAPAAANFYRRIAASRSFGCGFASSHPLADRNPRDRKDFYWW